MASYTKSTLDPYRVALQTSSIVSGLTSKGLACFDGNPSRRELVEIAQSLGRIYQHRDSDENGLTILEPKKGSAPNLVGFTAQHLFLHTDSSGELNPPDIIIFYCEQMAEHGGDSLFVDGRTLYLDMRERCPELLSILSSLDAAMFWSLSGHTRAAVLNQDETGRISFRFRLDDLVYFSRQLAYKLPLLVDLIESHTISSRLMSGEGFILNNGWWLHGRAQFGGYRRAVRVLIDSQTQVGCDSQRNLARGFDV